MKALNFNELDSIVKLLNTFAGAEVQSCVVSKREFAFRLHHFENGSLWVVYDLNPQAPMLIPVRKLPDAIKKQDSPLGLFFRAHFLGRSLVTTERPEMFGRLVLMQFSESHRLEARLFPHGQNLLLTTPEKSIAMKKPKPIEPLESDHAPKTQRSVTEVVKAWLEQFEAKHQSSKPEVNSPCREQKIKKLKKALKKLSQDLEKKQESRWREAGVWLGANQTLENIPKPLAQCVNIDRSFSWNLEACFEQAKKTEEKVQKSQQRIVELEKQIAELKGMSESEFQQAEAKNRRAQKQTPQLKSTGKQNFKSRKKVVASGIAIYVGKSAKDNLQILRKAKAWNLWFHLKDVPSAHAVAFFNKGQVMSEAEVHEAARFLLEVSRSQKSDPLLQQPVEVLVTECRYVSPIKGDQLGRVNYRNEKTLTLKP